MKNFSSRGREGRDGRDSRDGNRNNRNDSRSQRSDSVGGRDFNRGFNNSMNRQSFKSVCSDCGANCDLPFKPVEGRPVYCRDCFQKHKK